MLRFLALSCALLSGLSLSADTHLNLPFFNGSKSNNLDWVGESVSETIREAVARKGLLVLSREDREEAYRRLSIRPQTPITRASVLKLGEVLDADTIIHGEFYFTPPAPDQPPTKGTLRVLARVISLKKLRQSPQIEELGALEDLATLQTNIAWRVLQYIAPEAAPSREEFQRNMPTVRVDAIENYIRGLIATSADVKHRFFTQSARLDPRYSQPCFQLGRLNVEKKNYRVAAEWLEKVSSGYPQHREATFLLGLCRYHMGDFEGAQRAFQFVVQSVPLNEVLNNLAAAQSRNDQPDALENFRKVLEGDPNDPVYHFNVGFVLWRRNQFDAAAERFRAVLDRNPNDQESVVMLGRCLKRSGPRAGDPRSEGLERLKHEYRETAYLQLKEMLEPK